MPGQIKQQPARAITAPNTLELSMQGKYFVGQTDTLIIGEGFNAWGGLMNPQDSGITFHNTAVTITNFSDIPFLAQFWLDATPPGTGILSTLVCSAYSVRPPFQPKTELKFVQSIYDVPAQGVNVFNRLVPPKTTLVRNDDGILIFPPQGSLVIFLVSPGPESIQANIAFGWWEESC